MKPLAILSKDVESCFRPTGWLLFIITLVAGEILEVNAGNPGVSQIRGLGYYHAGTRSENPAVFRYTWSEHSTQKWFLTMEPVSGIGNHYQIEYTGAEVRTLVRRIAASGEQTYYANILPGPEPIQFTQPLIGTIWMAYSQFVRQQFRQSGSGTCPFSESGEVRQLRYERVGGESPGMPTRVTFFDDGLQGIGVRPRPAPYDKGFGQFVFEAEAPMQTNGIWIPRLARMVEFSPRPDAVSSNEVVARRSCELVTESFESTTDTGLGVRLPLGLPISVADVRLGNFRRAVFYNFTNSWPTLEHLRATPEYMEWRLKNRDLAQPPRTNAFRLAFIAAVMLLSAVGVYFGRRSFFPRQPPQINSNP